MRMRLKDSHPVMGKLKKIMDLMESEGVSLYVGPYNEVRVHYDSISYDLLDNEDGKPVGEFPPSMEYKLTYEKEGM